MRDGLSLLDQAIAYSAGNVTLESVREMLGTIDSTTLIRLLGALANHEPKEIMKVADEIGARSLSYTQAMKDLAVLLHRIAMAQQLPEILTDEVLTRPNSVNWRACFLRTKSSSFIRLRFMDATIWRWHPMSMQVSQWRFCACWRLLL